MRICLAITVCWAMAVSGVHAQPSPNEGGGVDQALLRQLLAGDTPTVQTVWEKQFDQAPTRESKLELLRKAWANSYDMSLSDLDRQAWHEVWLKAYKKTAIEDAMPNPYGH